MAVMTSCAYAPWSAESIFISFAGEPVKVLVSIFITSLGGLDEREMVSRVY